MLYARWVFREISSFRQSRNKLNLFNLFRLCRKNEILRQNSFYVVAKRQQRRSNIWLRRKIILGLVAFDNVASTLLLVWMGLNRMRTCIWADIHTAASFSGSAFDTPTPATLAEVIKLINWHFGNHLRWTSFLHVLLKPAVPHLRTLLLGWTKMPFSKDFFPVNI